MKQVDVLGIGQACIDYTGFVKEFPAIEQRVELEGFDSLCGGPTATTLTLLARLGMSTAIATRLGDDPEGRRLIAELSAEGIDTTHAALEHGRRTQVSLIPVEASSGRRTVFWSRGPASPAPITLPDSLLGSVRVVHVDDLYTASALACIDTAREKGAFISIDLGSVPEGAEELTDRADALIVSLEVMRELCGTDDPREGLVKLGRFGARITTVTLEEMGSATLFEGEVIETPAYAVDSLDTTGAGDAFRGAFLYAWLNDWDMVRALDFASAAGAMSTLGRGACGGMPTSLESVLAFMENGQLRHARP